MSKPLVVVAILLLLAGLAEAELVRLRGGRIVQGDVLVDRTDKDNLYLRLHGTGGEIAIPWSSIIEADRKRLREALLENEEEEREGPPVMDGHRVRLRSGKALLGLAENPAGEKPLVLKTPVGRQTIARAEVIAVEDVEVSVFDVYTTPELVALYRREFPQESAEQQIRLGDEMVRIRAFRAAAEHYRNGHADSDRIRRAEMLAAVQTSVERADRVRLLIFRKRFAEAEAELAALEEKTVDSVVRRLLGLIPLRRRLDVARIDHYTGRIEKRFFVLLDKELREAARRARIGTATAWVVEPKKMRKEILDALAAETKLTGEMVWQILSARDSHRLRRYGYGSGTEAQKWWKSATPKERERFLMAWFAEFGGVLKVVRTVERNGQRIVVTR